MTKLIAFLLALALLLTPLFASAAIARIQVKHQYTATSGTAYAFGQNVAAGDFIVVGVSGGTTGGAFPTVSVKDSQGNYYAPLSTSGLYADNTYLQFFYATSTGAGADSVKVTYDAHALDVGWTAVEYSGVKATSPLDTEATPLVSNTNTKSPTSNSFNPQAGSLVIAMFGDEYNPSPGVTTGTGITVFQSDTTHADYEGDNLSATAGSQTVGFNTTNTTSSFWGINVAAFLPASSAYVPSRKMRLFNGFKIKFISGKIKLYQQ